MNKCKQIRSGRVHGRGCFLEPVRSPERPVKNKKEDVLMKRVLLTVAAASAVLVSLPVAANAAPWQSINQRQANLERRIDQGVRRGDLTRPEAVRLRAEFRDLERLERNYRYSGGGLTRWEREDLDRRFDRLSHRIYAERHDRQDRTRRY
jgi:hypothetical protein